MPTYHNRNGDVSEFRQPAIKPSSYQTRLQAEDDLSAPHSDVQDETTGQIAETANNLDMRYWSDYNRLEYHPRSIQALHDVADWDNEGVNWSLGK